MNPQIEWREVAGCRCLVLTFKGEFSQADARTAVDTLAAMLGETTGKVTMVWETTEMSGYDNAAREMWQRYLGTIKQRIEAIHLVSQNVLIRSGAMIVGMFVGMRIVTWPTMEALEQR